MSVPFIKYKQGFTLIETLVSISIIALISGIFIANYRGAEKRSNLNLAAQKVASDIRLAQNYTLGLQEFNGSFPLGGWGVYFSTVAAGQYIIFADNGNYQYESGVDDEYRQVILPSGITINSIDIDPVSIVFEPPDPTTYINTVNNGEVNITLQESSSSAIKTVKVNFLGLIDVD